MHEVDCFHFLLVPYHLSYLKLSIGTHTKPPPPRIMIDRDKPQHISNPRFTRTHLQSGMAWLIPREHWCWITAKSWSRIGGR